MIHRFVQFAIVVCLMSALSDVKAQNSASQETLPLHDVKAVPVELTVVAKLENVKDVSPLD